MTTKSSHQKQERKDSGEALSPLLTLISGKKGPLPLDNDQRLKPQKNVENTSSGTQSSEREKTSGPFLGGIRQQAMEMYPGALQRRI
jgi:hypothetical protein